MSGTRPSPAERRLSEQHLGDRLSALIDGELGHETRERVLAHLATCARCKAEADAQRRLKNVFAEAAPPPPSESFLARLQGLPGGGDTTDGGGSPFGKGFGDGLTATPETAASGVFHGIGGIGGLGGFGPKRGERFTLGYVPARPHPPGPAAERGFRIHDVSRHDSDRSSSRGLRFAFVAAGAVSLAAIALGGVTTGAPTDTDARGAGSNVTPARVPATGTATNPEGQRRRGVVPLLAQGQGQRLLGDTPMAPTTLSAPLLPGIPAPTVPAHASQAMLHTLSTPVLAGAAVMSPLIRPLTATPPSALTSWSTTPEVLAIPDATSSPTAAELPRTTR
ncbi:anti-sigma factor family protein [Streptomyces sp. NPDC087425]|uniref:anti-sigma factor family protein n=1 Tax=Streptomyces sp. NPDC087425 TaxID=3365787 RepID=UPI00380E3B92